jgi:hypothetical protein
MAAGVCESVGEADADIGGIGVSYHFVLSSRLLSKAVSSDVREKFLTLGI